MDKETPKCKNCGDWIEWSHTLSGWWGWFHIRNGVMACYPYKPQAEPASSSAEAEAGHAP